MATIETSQIEFYNVSNGYLVPKGVGFDGYEVEESGFDSATFNGNLHPVADGYSWFRGFAVNLESAKELSSQFRLG